MKKTLLFLPALLLLVTNVFAQTGWSQNVRNFTTIENITYYFPESVSLTDREAYIKLCRDSVKEDLDLIHQKEFSLKMDVEFLSSRQEMLKLTGMAAQGMAMYPQPLLYSILKLENSPVKHEMMHMIAMHTWGNNAESWLNEGLATYAGGICTNFTLEQIYRYYMQSGKLVPINGLVNKFWDYNDMVTYTQSAYLVQYIIDNYGIDKFALLWKGGFAKFKDVYGFDFITMQDAIESHLKNKYPEDIDFNWDEFNKGCN